MLYQDAFLQRLETGLRATLPQWGLPDTAPVSLLTISENATYVVEDESNGRRLVLRVHRPAYHTEAEILSELAWISTLRQDDVVETPRIVPAKDGTLLCSFPDGDTHRYVVAFEHMSGKEPDPSDDLVKWYGRLGEINARLHMHSRNWQRPSSFVRPYFGGGFGLADLGFSYVSPDVRGGIDLGGARRVGLRIEGRYQWILGIGGPDARMVLAGARLRL